MKKKGEDHEGSERKFKETIIIGLIVLLSTVWGLYGQALLPCIGGGKWCIVPISIILPFALIVTRIDWHWWKKRKFKIAVFFFLLGIAVFLPSTFSWQDLLAALCLGAAAWLVAVWLILPKKQHPHVPKMIDKYGRGLLYRKLQEQLFDRVVEQNMRQERDRTGVLIAVTGEWGSGKTHFIDHTIYELDVRGRNKEEAGSGTMHRYTGKFHSATVDVWKAASADDIWQEIAQALIRTVRGEASDHLVGNTLVRAFLEHKFRGSLAMEIAKLLSMGKDAYAMIHSQIAHEIKQQANEGIYSLLVLDNIDRCRVDILRVLFPALESLKHMYGLVILCGIAKGDMVPIMGAETPDLSSALLKIFDAEFTIPQLTEREQHMFKQRQVVPEGSYFAEWFKEQNFSGVSPRLVQRICDHNSRLSKTYLERHRKKQDVWEEIHDSWKGRSKTIFNFEALRVAFPNFPLPVGDSLDDGQKTDTLPPGFRSWCDYIRARYGTVTLAETNPTRYGLYRIAYNLSKAKEEDLEYLRKQEYFNILSLTYDECELCLHSEQKIDSILAGKECGAKAIDSCIKNHIEPENMPAVLLSLYDHCVSEAKGKECMYFMKKFFKKGWHSHQELGLEKVFPLDYAAVMLRLAVFQDEDNKEDDVKLKDVFASIGFEGVAQLADFILNCVHDKDAWNDNFTGRDLAWSTRMMLKGFNENWDIKQRKWKDPAYGKIMTPLLEQYAEEACTHLHKYEAHMTYSYYKNLIIGRSCPPEVYEDDIRKGAGDYAKSLTRNQVDVGIDQLLNLVTIKDAITEQPEPFAVLSFALVWQVLFNNLAATESRNANKQKIDDLLRHIKQREKADDALTDKERKQWRSKQFWDNRKKAMEILKTTLEGPTESQQA